MDQIEKARGAGRKSTAVSLDARPKSFLQGLFSYGKPELSQEDTALVNGLQRLGFKLRFRTDTLGAWFTWKAVVALH